jgi:hypothetical protein
VGQNYRLMISEAGRVTNGVVREIDGDASTRHARGAKQMIDAHGNVTGISDGDRYGRAATGNAALIRALPEWDSCDRHRSVLSRQANRTRGESVGQYGS